MRQIVISTRNTMLLPKPDSAGQWVRYQRRNLGLTQTELARRAGLTQRLVSEFETGKAGVRLDTLLKLFQALDLRLAAVDLKADMEPDDEVMW